jgi:hypothetical protein
MTNKKLLVFSGADRVGKSTIIKEIAENLDSVRTYHHGAPPHEPESIFDFYRDHIQEWVAGGEEWCLMDRAWPCSFALETFRRRNNGHLDDIIDLELELLQCDFKVMHVVIRQPWCWSAPRHLEEIEQLKPNAPLWITRDEYVSRMKEHRVYYDKMKEFMEDITAFPLYFHESASIIDVDARMIITQAEKILK